MELSVDAIEMYLPMPANLANARFGHRMQEVRAKNAYHRELTRRRVIRYYVPPPPATPPARARVVVLFHIVNAGHANDRDNRYARAKWILDWLRHKDNRYIAGDREEQCELVCANVVGKEAMPELCSVKVTITPIE